MYIVQNHDSYSSLTLILVIQRFSSIERLALASLLSQDISYDQTDLVIVTSSFSDDQLYLINEFVKLNYPDLNFNREFLTILPNLGKTLSTGWNAALRASRRLYSLRIDAHSFIYPDYVSLLYTSILDLPSHTLCVGGSLTTIPSTYQFSSEQLVISHLLSSPFVVGPSFRTIKNTHTTPKLSSTSVYALYRNSLLCNLNYFNECCLRSQDLDLHHRAHLNSFLTYCLPVAKAVYQPGSNLKNIIHKAYYNGFPAAYNVIRLKQYIPLLFLSLF